MTRRLLIIGNGMAADRLVDELILRDALRRYDVTIVGEELYGAYNRIMLAQLLEGGEPDDLVTKPVAWYAEHGIELITGRWVQRLDTARRWAHIGNGERVPYDVAVFATGSAASIPPVSGLNDLVDRRLPGVHVFREMADAMALRAETDPALGTRRAVVVGAGLLGLEAAKACVDRGHPTTVIHPYDTLLNTQLDRLGGALLRTAVEGLGIEVVVGRTAALLARERVEAVRLADDRILPADTVVFATGVRPRTEAAVASGLDVHRAIVVDDHLRTSAPDVYAIGECAEHDATVFGLVTPCWDHAKVLADLLAGAETPGYRGSPLSTRLKVAGIEVASMGVVDAEHDTDHVVQVIEERRGVYRKLIVRDGTLVGAILVGDPDNAALLVQMFERGTPVPANPVDLFCSLDAYTGGAADGDVCSCNRVSEATLVEAIAAGASSVDDLKAATRAGTGCGSCVGSLTKLLADHVPAPA